MNLFSRLISAKSSRSPAAPRELQHIGGTPVEVAFVTNLRARRYIIRVRHDRSIRVTIPRRGNLTFAREFLARHTTWIGQQLTTKSPAVHAWNIGTTIHLRGTPHIIEPGPDPAHVRLGEFLIPVNTAPDLRRDVELFLWKVAASELPARLAELSALHGIPVKRISVRNQRSRWGSCSRRGTISLNWRLIQVPPDVRDYILLHELAHVRHMNHSAAFWVEVQRLCPTWQSAELYLKRHCLR